MKGEVNVSSFLDQEDFSFPNTVLAILAWFWIRKPSSCNGSTFPVEVNEGCIPPTKCQNKVQGNWCLCFSKSTFFSLMSKKLSNKLPNSFKTRSHPTYLSYLAILRSWNYIWHKHWWAKEMPIKVFSLKCFNEMGHLQQRHTHNENVTMTIKISNGKQIF